MMHMVDGLKNYDLERRRSSRGKEYLSEVTTMQNVLWAGFSSLHLMGYVQAQSSTYHCGVLPFENSEVLSIWYGGNTKQNPQKPSLRAVARSAFANIMDFLLPNPLQQAGSTRHQI